MSPLYRYRCKHGDTERHRTVDARDALFVGECGCVLIRVITPPMLFGDNMPGGVTGRSGDGYFEDKHGNRSDPKTTEELAKRKEWEQRG